MQGNRLNIKNFIFENYKMPNVYTVWETENIPRTQTATFAPTNNSATYWYMGFASKSSTSVNVLFEVTTVAGGFTAQPLSNYYQFLIGKGPLPNQIGNLELTKLGYVDATSQVSTVGTKYINIPLTAPLGTGDEFWFGICLSANPVGALRGTSNTNALRTRMCQMLTIGRRFGGTGTTKTLIPGTSTLIGNPLIYLTI